MSPLIDWNQTVTLYRRISKPQGEAWVQEIATGSLHTMIVMARKGHEGPLEHMLIRTSAGIEYSSSEIAELAMRPDRPRFVQRDI